VLVVDAAAVAGDVDDAALVAAFDAEVAAGATRRDAAVLVGAAGAERAGGASARENYLSASARTTTRPASARNYFAGTARRVELSGKPLGGVNYSTYSLIGGEKR
jgi:hypothetical protein